MATAKAQIKAKPSLESLIGSWRLHLNVERKATKRGTNLPGGGGVSAHRRATRNVPSPLDVLLTETQPGEALVELTVTAQATIETMSGTVVFESYRPNRGLCPPSCAGADIAIVDGSLVNAEPGAFPEARIVD